MVRHGMVSHSVNSETNPCRTMHWAPFRLDSLLGTLASNECSAELTSICLSAYGSEKESLRICLKDDLHSSSCLDARISLVDVGCLKDPQRV